MRAALKTLPAFMKYSSAALASVALAALGAGIGATYFPRSHAPRESGANAALIAPVPVDPASPRVLLDQEAGRPTRERSRQVALEIERALVASDPQQRETVFNVLLPELLEGAPGRVIAMVARQESGEARDALRDEVARQWITSDRDAAIEWMGTLDETERRASATIAMRTLAASDPAQAIRVADLFGVGRDDGSLEHMVQIWATENPREATRWLESQPANDPRTAQLRARIGP